MQELKFQRAKISDKVQKVLNRRKQTSVTSTSTDALPEESGSFMQPSWSVGLAIDHEYLPVAGGTPATSAASRQPATGSERPATGAEEKWMEGNDVDDQARQHVR